MRSSSLESVTVAELQATEAYPSLDLNKEKYCISRLSMVGKENVTVRFNHSNFIAREKNIDTMMKIKFTINMYTQILNANCSQYKRRSKSVLII
jgi:hypothetical protein